MRDFTWSIFSYLNLNCCNSVNFHVFRCVRWGLGKGVQTVSGLNSSLHLRQSKKLFIEVTFWAALKQYQKNIWSKILLDLNKFRANKDLSILLQILPYQYRYQSEIHTDTHSDTDTRLRFILIPILIHAIPILILFLVLVWERYRYQVFYFMIYLVSVSVQYRYYQHWYQAMIHTDTDTIVQLSTVAIYD